MTDGEPLRQTVRRHERSGHGAQAARLSEPVTVPNLSGKPSGRSDAARSPRAQAARLRLSPVRRRDYPANLSGKPSGGKIAAGNATGTA